MHQGTSFTKGSDDHNQKKNKGRKHRPAGRQFN